MPKTENIKFHDLYELYPEFNINIKYEQELLQEYDIIIWQHPMYWYSCPPILKQWIDMVLEYNWAYGSKGDALRNKLIFQVITTGGKRKITMLRVLIAIRFKIYYNHLTKLLRYVK